MSEDFRDPNRAVDYIIAQAPRFAAAKAQRIYLEEFRKSKKAMLVSKSTAKTVAERESEAYAHDDYIALLEGLKAAVEVEEKLRWDLVAAQARVEIWRTQEASARAEGRATR